MIKINQMELLQYIRENYKSIGINPNEIVEIRRLNTGKRNNCYCIVTRDKKLFCKTFNKNLRYASQFDKTRYNIEKNALIYLHHNGIFVPDVNYADDNEEIVFLQYIEGITLKQAIRMDKSLEPLLIKKTLDEI